MQTVHQQIESKAKIEKIPFDKIINLPDYISIVAIVGSSGAIISIFMWSLNPLSDFQCSTDKTRGFVSRVIDTTNFVTTWVIVGFLVFEIFMYFTTIDLKNRANYLDAINVNKNQKEIYDDFKSVIFFDI